MAFYSDLSVLDAHVWRRLPWCLDECLSTLSVPRQSPRGSRKTSARLPSLHLHRCPSRPVSFVIG